MVIKRGSMFKNKLVLLASLFINMGIVLIMPITTLFIHRTLGKSLLIAGFVLMAFSLAQMAGNLLGGFLFDRWQPKQSMYLGGAITVVSLALITIFPIWLTYSLLVATYGFGLGILNASVNGYLAFLKKDDPQIFNNNYWLASLGSGLASFLSGILFGINVRLVFGFSTILFILTLILVRLSIHPVEKNTKLNNSKAQKTHSFPHLWPVVLVCLSFVIAWMGYEQWDTNISTFMISQGISVQAYSVLFTINAIVLLIIQPITKIVFRDTFRADKWRIISGIVMFSFSYLVIIDASNYWQFVVGIVILTFGEILAFPAIPSMLNRFATDENRGRIQSFGSLAGSLGRAIGPAIGGFLVTSFSYPSLFVTVFLLHILIAIVLLSLKRHKKAPV